MRYYENEFAIELKQDDDQWQNLVKLMLGSLLHIIRQEMMKRNWLETGIKERDGLMLQRKMNQY